MTFHAHELPVQIWKKLCKLEDGDVKVSMHKDEGKICISPFSGDD